MIEIIETKSSNLLEIKIIEEATTADINRIKPVLKKHTVESSDPRLILIFSGFKEWSQVVQFWTNMNMNREQVNEFSRIALVGNPSWKGWLTGAIERMVDTSLKFFDDTEMKDARTWVNQ